jgi:hypothetical protein
MNASNRISMKNYDVWKLLRSSLIDMISPPVVFQVVVWELQCQSESLPILER